VAIMVGGRTLAADKRPEPDEFRQLLLEVQRELAALAARADVLGQISPAAPAAARGAEATLKDAVDSLTPNAGPEQATTIKTRLSEATSLLTTVLDGTKAVADKAGEAGKSIQSLAEQVAPLLDRLRIAALWAAKLWLP
jgi:hypothetical protein